MSFLTLSVAGATFIFIGSWEAFTARNRVNPPNKLYPALFVISLLFVGNSLLSLSDAINAHDRVGSALQLQVLAVTALFFLYSVLGLFQNFSTRLLPQLPSSLLDLICMFLFMEEFMLFYMQKKDTSGIENRYFDLLLFPIAVCLFSTVMELKSPESGYPPLARGVGLILQGTWLLQMGISFYTDMMVQGCSLHEKSRGNYTIRCKGHPEYHRGRAIATLQFNCHLAFMVVLVVGAFSFLSRRSPGHHPSSSEELSKYEPIAAAEMLPLEHHAKFTLDFDNGDNHLSQGEESVQQVKTDHL